MVSPRWTYCLPVLVTPSSSGLLHELPPDPTCKRENTVASLEVYKNTGGTISVYAGFSSYPDISLISIPKDLNSIVGYLN